MTITFFSADKTDSLSPGCSLSGTSEGQLQSSKRGTRIQRSFCNKDHVAETWYGYCLRKTRHLKLMKLVVFYVWEDAGVWAHWNHSFDMRLSSPRPLPCVPTTWVSSGCTVSAVMWQCDSCSILSLLMWQAIFFIHITSLGEYSIHYVGQS